MCEGLLLVSLLIDSICQRTVLHVELLAPPVRLLFGKPGAHATHCSLCWCCVCLQVLYSKFGFMYTELKVADEEFILIREDDVIGEGGGWQYRHGVQFGRGSGVESAAGESSRLRGCRALYHTLSPALGGEK